jgi:hypothetical protein
MHTYSCEENVRGHAMRAHRVKKMSTNAMQRFAQRRQPDRMRNMLRISCKRMRGIMRATRPCEARFRPSGSAQRKTPRGCDPRGVLRFDSE